ncbi:RagB/SusD family nutrient uptake outer membrane protein [Chryseolinea lacunae]|uniref:RagB/SusD family nutrient uptake outer membrane protein n=1 Tax=Chryseolinea lacunae TaxID=2801331 RepID=A0ABS1KJE4_9BACT|nr:RagB/SusD family nutrient uptake outer membrane protein [Chryseolinea lacunae]MBL0739578.1 RagB/SusD family nutrient uptake outer membrane protein [Chryseolinea lacunae]
MKSFSTILYTSLFAILLVTGCSDDFLDRPSLSELNADNFYLTPDELRLATAALYSGGPWGEWTYAAYLPVGDVLSGNMVLGYNGDAVQFNTFSVTDANGGLTATWKGMYKVIAHCNATINGITQKSPSTISDAIKNAALAEARFIRAYAYFNLAVLWKDVPIIEDNTLLVTSPLVPRNEVNDVYQFIVNDLNFAARNLPAADKGRATTWSAQGMLAKVYLTWAALKSPGIGQRDQALLDLAKLHAGNVCNGSGLMLLGFSFDGQGKLVIDPSGYSNLFKTQYNDNQESLFSLQWHPSTSDWLSGNMLQLYSSGGQEISASGTAGWFSISPTYDMYLQYSEGDNIRRKATFMYRGDNYPELNAAGGGFTYAGDAGLKKHIVGTRADNSSPTMTHTSSPEHNALLRLADVYLLYAEAIMGNDTETVDMEAIKYFNKVRRRAGLDTLNNATDKLTADMLFKERRIELAAEGHFWYDLVRLYYYNSKKAIDFLNDQKERRVTFTYNADTHTATQGNPFGDITDASAGTFRFPLPPSEVTANPKLAEPPVPYSFK